jgi:acetyl esterase/lipase
MKASVIFTSLLLFVAGSGLAQQKVISLYSGPVPGSESWTWTEAENDKNAWQTRVVYNVSKPTLTVFQPEEGKGNGTAIIIAPGGAFHALSIDSEGYDVAKWLAQKGVTCFVLKYRLARSLTNDPVAEVNSKMGKKEFDDENAAVIPLGIADGREAIAYVRKHAAEYNVLTNRIGIMGFSAGGTVTSGTLFNYIRTSRRT